MAVCNIFNRLKNPTGTFLMFSQYVEDLTRESTQSVYYRVIPSKFIACNINYTNHNNDSIPRELQNRFENGCAVCRRDMEDTWIPTHSSNLFWNAMFDMGLITGTDEYINEINYVGDINLQSYNEHDGIGYSEIYCYIPNDARECKYQYNISDGSSNEYLSNLYLEGYKKDELDAWEALGNIMSYFPDKNTQFPWTNDALTSKDIDSNKFEVNTIIVLYDILTKSDSGSKVMYSNIPMGIYFTGLVDDDVMGNSVTKYVSNKDIYGAGTSYGLRICSRFTVTPNQNNIKVLDVTLDNDNYSAISQVMSQMSESQNKMDDILAKIQSNTSAEKELLAIFKNSRTNVPYVKSINGTSYWFVNGKNVAPILGDLEYEYIPYTKEEILYMLSRSSSLSSILKAVDDNDENILDLSESDFYHINLSWEILMNEYETTPDELKLTVQTENDIYVEQLEPNINNVIMKNVSESTTYTITAEKDGLTTDASATVNMIYPTYFGTLDCNNYDALEDSHKLIVNEQDIKSLPRFKYTARKQEHTYTNITDSNGSTDHVVLAYPKSFGQLKSILDGFNYEYIDDFDMIETIFTFGTTQIPYLVYIDKYPSEVEDFKLKFM